MKAKTQRTLLTILRQKLGTWPQELPVEPWVDQRIVASVGENNRTIEPLINRVHDIGELFVGMANGPFLLVMKADEPMRFIEYADAHPTHEVSISIEEFIRPDVPEKVEYQTVIRPADGVGAYRLVFGLPAALEDQILLDENRGVRLAPGIKKRFFSEITVYRRLEGRDVMYRLIYSPQSTRNQRLASGHRQS